ncbi:MAG: hypothetical protein EOP86_24815, partial [Verrucomicrobiaceae bacterium]
MAFREFVLGKPGAHLAEYRSHPMLFRSSPRPLAKVQPASFASSAIASEAGASLALALALVTLIPTGNAHAAEAAAAAGKSAPADTGL